MPTFDPTDLVGRTFLLPPEENGERHRTKVTRNVVEIIDQENGHRVENSNFILDIGNGKVEECWMSISSSTITAPFLFEEQDE